jgi:hypothetical protein
MIVTATVAVYHHTVVTPRTKIVSDLVISLGLSHILNHINTAIAFGWLSGIDPWVQLFILNCCFVVLEGHFLSPKGICPVGVRFGQHQ